MKFKMKHAAAALALAIAGQAGAQTLTALPGTGNPSLFFVAIDEAAGRSYFSEMVATAGSTTTGALRMDDVLSNPTGSWTINLSGLNAFTAGSSTPLADIYGGFGAAEANPTVGGGTTVQTGSRRILASVAEDAPAPNYNNGMVLNAPGFITNFHNSFQGVGDGLCNTSPCVATSGSALNYAGLTNPSLQGIGLQLGLSAGPTTADSLSGTVAWDLYLAVSNSNTQILAATVTQLALRAVLNLATNTLTISSPNIVPVPAAVWLFGSAVLGLVGVGRRKKGALANNGLVAA